MTNDKMTSETESRTPVDLLIHNAMVLTLNDADDIYHPGVVAVSDDEIIWVGPEDSWPTRFEPREQLDMAGGLLMPGLINAPPMTYLFLFGLTNISSLPKKRLAAN
jgi:5-methylthioadenosine/S-adenosylhomocysteine deaminase